MSHNYHWILTLSWLWSYFLFFRSASFSSGSTFFKETLRTRRKTDANSSNCILTFMFFFRKFVWFKAKLEVYSRNEWRLSQIQFWIGYCSQIHEIKQNMFFCGIFYSWVFLIFWGNWWSVPVSWPAGHLLSIRNISGISWNFSISSDFKFFFFSCVGTEAPPAGHLRQLAHSLPNYDNLVPFHLWLKKIGPKREKVYKYFVQDCSSILDNGFWVCLWKLLHHVH